MEIARRIQNNLNKVEEPWENEDVCLGNRTNPNSIYTQGRFKFKGYNLIELDCFVDTGSSLCLASKYVIPESLWENAPHPIKAKIADGSEIKLDKIVKDLVVFFAGERFIIHETYQQETGIDFLLGNNFCQQYEPLVQYTDRIYLRKKNDYNGKLETILIQKRQIAYQRGLPGFLDSKKKLSKKHSPEPINITP